jgi:uncharacterized protein (TIGR00255 family)
MQSMTGFGRVLFQWQNRSFRLEIRTLNNRFLDVRLRTPWTDAALDNLLSAAVKKRLSRGRVELSIWDDPTSGEAPAMEPNLAVAAALSSTLDALAAEIGCDRQSALLAISPVKELLRVGRQSDSSEDVWQVLEPALGSALDELLAMREREGLATQTDLKLNLQQLATLIRDAGELLDGEPQRQRLRLEERLQQILDDRQVDPARLAQEVAVLVDRSDAGEELARLKSHMEQMEEMLETNGAVGRKIEFMLQELNREMNTIASKTTNPEISALVVEGKSCLERMREQCQNVQ